MISTYVLQLNQGFDLLDVQMRFGYDLHRSHLTGICPLAPNNTKGTGAESILGVPYGRYFYTALLRLEVCLEGYMSH